MRVDDVLEEHGLPVDGLRPVGGGTANRVWATEDHVVRIGSATNHAREAQLARAAIGVGVRTPRPVAWSETYGIWERLAGSPPNVGLTVMPRVWRALLKELERLHAHPLEDFDARRDRVPWQGRPWLIEATQEKAAWTPSERERLHSALGGRVEDPTPVFVHGDAHAGNVLIDNDGRYVAILDWGCAGWASLEAECARLEDEALALACERWADRLDLDLVWRMRVDLFLEVVWHGRMPFERLRRLLEHGPY